MRRTKGRPTKQQELELKERFHQCYLRGYNVESAARKIGTNNKTAYAHYEKIIEKISNINDQDFFEKVKSSLEQTTLSYDFLLDEYYSLLDLINEKLSANKDETSLPYNLVQHKITILKDIKNVLKEKTVLMLQKPFDEMLDQMIQEKIEKYGKSDQQT